MAGDESDGGEGGRTAGGKRGKAVCAPPALPPFPLCRMKAANEQAADRGRRRRREKKEEAATGARGPAPRFWVPVRGGDRET